VTQDVTMARSGRPVLTALILLLLWTACRLAWLMHTGIPEPVVHDEFAYLLGADTFAHGRLTNPPHALGEFFESPMILVRPSYAPKYPPGQSLFLALGQRLFGAPFYGVVIGDALMLFTFSLMLFAWVPYRWGLAVAAMLALCLQPAMYWMSSYWGGAVAASGAALVLLGIGMYRAKQRALPGAIFAFGALLLFWTRPFEGGIFTLTVLILFVRELWSKRTAGAVLAALLVLAPGAAWTCWYNKAVTGSPWVLPYLLYERQYNVAPVLWLLPLRPEPVYSHPRLAAQMGTNGTEAADYRAQQPWPEGLRVGFSISLLKFASALGIAVLLTMLVPAAWSDPNYRRMAVVTGAMLLTLTLETWHHKHYMAPAWAAQVLMIAIWAERTWNLRFRNRPVGVAMGVILVLIASPASIALQSAIALPRDWLHRRTELIERLSETGRPQLAIIRYPFPGWAIGADWVYNGADIDRQQVIFAHDLGMEKNRALLSYYGHRQAVLVSFDEATGKMRVEPYPPPL
jgi:hypothetical protein